MLKLFRILVLAAAAAMPATLLAQAWPAKPIRVVVPFPPGAAVDLTARLLQQHMATGLGQPVIIENRAGATGMIGADYVVRAASDGYTLLYMPGSGLALRKFISINPVPDIQKDLTPIASTMELVNSIVVSAALPVVSMKELVEFTKKNPGKLNYGSAGVASTQHLTGEVLGQQGVNMVNVPFNGLQPALAALLAGHIQVGIFDLATTRGQVKEGKLKLLAITPAKRYSGAPQVPTVSETLPGFEMPDFWMGYFGPANLPPAIVRRLNAEVNQALAAPDVMAKLAEQSFNVVPMSPEELQSYVKRSVDAHERVITSAKIPKQ